MPPDAPVVVEADTPALICAIVRRGRSQGWIARQLSVSSCTVSRWATGQTRPGPTHLDRLRVLADHLHDTRVDHLFDAYLSALRDLRFCYHAGNASALHQTLTRMGQIETQLRAVLGSAITKDSQDGLSASDRPPYRRGLAVLDLPVAGGPGSQALGASSGD